MCHWCSSQCHQHSGLHSQGWAELSQENRSTDVEAKWHSFRLLLWLGLDHSGAGSVCWGCCVLSVGLSTNKLLRLIPLQRESSAWGIPEILKGCTSQSSWLLFSALSSSEMWCWPLLLCFNDDGDGTDTLEFLVFRIFLWWQVWILSLPRTPGSQELASGENGAGQSCASLILKVKPPLEEWGV